MERDSRAASAELYKVEDLARRTTKEIRHMLFTLRPLILETQGLVAALQQLAEKVHDTHEQNVLIEAEPRVADDLEVGKQGVIFYIAEEAINNARKHAEAEHIWVRLRRDPEFFTLEVQDDGVGFNVGAVDENYEQRGSLGMVNMRERAELVSGALRLDSAEGQGTRISLVVPLSMESAERLQRAGYGG
jgi:signal transduction histidine kinase